jgi:hypothetical protein
MHNTKFIYQTVTCHKTEGTSNQDNRSKQTMTFRIKDGRVEAEKPILNLWAGQCQSKVVQKLVRGEDRVFMMVRLMPERFF